MKIIVAGGRDFNNYDVLETIMSKFKIDMEEDIIVSGDARGADTLGVKWAENHFIRVKHFPADWDYYGHAAGFIRNLEMADYADTLIAFWDGQSKGTEHMIKTAKKQKLSYFVFDYNGKEIEHG